jgi:hypothetical protein
VRYSFDPEKLFKIFYMKSPLYIVTGFESEFKVKFEICNDNDKENLSKFINNFDFPVFGVNFCPRFNSKIETIKNLDFFRLDFEIRECTKIPGICTPDGKLYEDIRNGRHYLSSTIYFVNSLIDLKNPEKPFVFKLSQFFQEGH